MSKYIPKKPKGPLQWSTFMTLPIRNEQEDKEWEVHKNHQIVTKNRIESIPLEDLTFKDLYQFPFHKAPFGSWVYDKNSNFIFQFEFRNKDVEDTVIAILNEELLEYKKQEISHENGEIYVTVAGEKKPFILIRGWGNLTGVGAYNLDSKYAAKIQDTLAEYIVEKLKP